MKKSIFYLIAVLTLLLTASCQKDEAPAGEETNVTFTTDLSGKVLSRAIADGLSVNKLAFAVYDESGTEIPALRQYVAVAGKTATVSVRLVSGKKYSFAFFAYKASTGNESTYYNVADLKAIKVSTDYSVNKGNDESRDAFFAYDSETITANLAKTITLRRPFSQLNIVATDVADAEASNVQLPAKADVTVSNVCTTLNALTGEVSDPVTVTIPAGAKIAEGITVAGTTYDSKAYVAMNYLLVAKDKGLSDCSIKIADNTDATLTTLSIPNVPVQRNYRTNIIGSLLTNSSKFSIIVDPEFETPDYNVGIASNSTKNTTYNSLQDAIEAAASGDVIELSDGVYPLTADLQHWVGSGFVNIKDKNLTIKSRSGDPSKCIIYAAYDAGDSNGAAYDYNGKKYTGIASLGVMTTFTISGSSSVTFSGVTIMPKARYNINQLIYADGTGTLTLDNCVVKPNNITNTDPNWTYENFAGAIFVSGKENLKMTNTTYKSGIVYTLGTGTYDLNGCTFDGVFDCDLFYWEADDISSMYYRRTISTGNAAGATMNITNCKFINMPTATDDLYAWRMVDGDGVISGGNYIMVNTNNCNVTMTGCTLPSLDDSYLFGKSKSSTVGKITVDGVVKIQ